MKRNILLTALAVLFAAAGYEMVIRAVRVTGTPRAVPEAGAAMLLAAVAVAAYLVIRFQRSLEAPATSKAAVVARGVGGAIGALIFLLLLIGMVGHFMSSGSDAGKATDALKKLEKQEQQLSHAQAQIDAAEKALAAVKKADATTQAASTTAK